MPTAWQSRDLTSPNVQYQHDAPARRIGDILMDPFRWATCGPVRKVASGVLVGGLALVLIF